MKRKLTLLNPIDKGDGMSQTKVELNYVYIHDESVVVYTKQGNTVILPMTPGMQKFVDKLEDEVVEKLNESQPQPEEGIS